MRLLFASSNQGKIREVSAILNSANLEIITLDQLDEPWEEVEETGSTFEENALLKAKYFAQLAKIPSLADDSGLTVETLNGEPGVHSNRWHPGTDHERNIALIDRLKGNDNRQAKFVTLACYFDPVNNLKEFFRGEIIGEIAHEPAGNEGFGYDPIFIPEGYDKTFSELGMDVKNKLSHRAIAYTKARNYLESNNLI